MMNNAHAYRYAIYFAPLPDSPWWQAGSAWLGRCAARQENIPQPVVNGVSATEFFERTAAPRRYGWHATLKAPFFLHANSDLSAIRLSMRTLSQRLQPFDMPAFQVIQLDNFLALVPKTQSEGITTIANACVTDLHPHAQALSALDLQRRRQASLSPREDALLLRWGYPYVMECFRFHCSLTGSLQGLENEQIQALHDAANEWFGSLPPRRFESLALFAEPVAGADFKLLEHFKLGV
jgi:Protein of unknown function (DUF1045)